MRNIDFINSVRLNAVHFFTRIVKQYSIAVLFLLLFLGNAVRAQILINEVAIAPVPPGGSGSPANEFIELFNKSNCALNIGCYTLVYSTTSGGSNPAGWTIKIPSGSSIPACGYFVIGGIAGQAGVSGAGTGYPTGGTPNPYNGAANFNVGTVTATANTVYMLQGINAGSFNNSAGQLTLLNSAGAVVSSVSYNNGNDAGSYPLSAYTTCNAGGNIQGVNNIPILGNSPNNINAVFHLPLFRGFTWMRQVYINRKIP